MQCGVTTTIRLEHIPSRDLKRDRPSLAVMAMLKSDADLVVSVKPSTKSAFEGILLLKLVGEPSSLSGWRFIFISSRPRGKLLGKHNVSQDG